MSNKWREWKHKLGFCPKANAGFKCYGRYNYKECGYKV